MMKIQGLPAKVTRIGGLPRRIYPSKYGQDELGIGEFRLIPWECLTDLKNPLGTISNVCYAYAKRHGMPKGAFTCLTMARGIEIYRVK